MLKKTSQEAIAEIMEVSQPTILRAPAVGLRSATGGATLDAKAITTSGLLEEIDPSCCIADKSYIGTGVLTPYKKSPNSELTKAQKQANKSLNEIQYVVERTIVHIKAWKILAHDCRRPLHTFKETITAPPTLHARTNPRITFHDMMARAHSVIRYSQPSSRCDLAR